MDKNKKNNKIIMFKMVICVLYDMIKRWIKKREKKDLPAIVVDVIHKLNNELDSVFPSVRFGINHFAEITKQIKNI